MMKVKGAEAGTPFQTQAVINSTLPPSVEKLLNAAASALMKRILRIRARPTEEFMAVRVRMEESRDVIPMTQMPTNVSSKVLSCLRRRKSKCHRLSLMSMNKEVACSKIMKT